MDTNAIAAVELSDIVGIILIFIAISMLAISARRKAINKHSILDSAWKCPTCGAVLARVHRKRYQRILGVLFLVRMMPHKCKKCGFTVSVWRSWFERQW